jgi:hypothetical protein
MSRQRSVILEWRSVISAGRFFGGIEIAKVDLTIINVNTCSKFLVIKAEEDSAKTTRIIAVVNECFDYSQNKSHPLN